ncbi:hypothetical protein [Polyangium sorediatum]|uniref:PEGA domain-containing protein n=1 Tax=Polyangium sorediatum TaxID=889274 RepID=A0ABT6NWU7_9BACT|nr:hypothetical protein [Polyangium sorediatum]MDI1432825.1 hypothetical protein [Polyangium sorediatum]
MMNRRLWLVLLVALSAPMRAYADEDTKPAPPPSNPALLQQATHKARFTALVAKAERERRAGRLAEAATAYAEAFEIEQDPLVAGRLGVLLVEFGNPTEAADLLLDAIERATDAPAAERKTFLKAYDTARARVCRVEVTVSEAHTQISLDGVVKQSDGITGFTMFIPPGEHELRAKLKGFEDGVTSFTASKGGTLRVELTLLPVRAFVPIEPPLRLKRLRPELAVNLEEPPNDEPAREPIVGGVAGEEQKKSARGSVSAGPVIVFGVASWQPAIGAVVAGSLRPNEFVSLGLEARAAWLTSGVRGRKISAMTAGGLVSACGHWRWLFGCALGHLGVLNIEGAEGSYVRESYANLLPGLGARVGATWRLTRSFTMQAGADIVGLTRGLKIVAGKTVLVEQPPVLAGAHFVGGWEF